MARQCGDRIIIVSIDSIGCQTDIAETIIGQNAHYVLPLKGNHGKLYEQVGDFFDIARQHDDKTRNAKPHASCEKDHGRIESRRVLALSSEPWDGVGAWGGLKSMIRVESPREIGEKITSERRFYIRFCRPTPNDW